tara:strand:- start:1350 stop:1745 length:396 start_codon:yes stop_codon:yes gene_type:complete
MSKKDIVIKFNNITRNLLSDMKHIIGNSYYTKFNLITRINSTYPITKFKLNVLKFKKYIFEKNSEYFENDTIVLNEINNCSDIVSQGDKEYYLNEFYYLKNIYENIDYQSKENFWDILQVLIFLCENYHLK